MYVRVRGMITVLTQEGKKIWRIYLEGTHKRELVQKNVRFLGFESFRKQKKLKRDLANKMVNVVPDLSLYCVTFHCVLCY